MNNRNVLFSVHKLRAWTRNLRQQVRVLFARTPLGEARVLIDTTRAIASMPDVVELMTTILEQLDRIVPATSATISLIDGDLVRLVAARGLPTMLPQIGSSWPRTSFPLNEIIAATRAPISIIDVRRDNRWRMLEGGEHVRSWLGLPLLAQDEVLGFLSLDRDEPVGFRANEIHTAQAFGLQLALALRLANLAANRQQQLADLAELYALSRTAGASLELDIMLPLLADHLQTLVGSTSCLIMLIDDDGQMQPAAADSALNDAFRQMRLAPNEPSAGHEVIRQRSPLVIANAAESDVVNHRLLQLSKARSLLALPLLVQAEAIGAVIFGDIQQPHRFSDEIVKHAEVVVSHAALAIANSRLFEASQRHTRELILRDRVRMSIAAAPLELDALALQVTTSLEETFGYAFVNCWAPEAEQLVLVSASGQYHTSVGLTLSLHQGICGRVARTGKPVLLKDVHSCSSYISYDVVNGTVKDASFVPMIVSEVCVPVHSRDRVVLVLNVEHTQRLGERDLRMMTEIATQVGLALDHIQLVKEVQRVQDDLARAARMAAVGTLAAGVAHEFNNMLAAMVGYAQLGLVGSTEEQVEALQMVLTMAQRGKHLTGSLLTFAEGDSGRRMTVTLDDLVDQGLEVVEGDLAREEITLQRERNPQAMVAVDPAQLVQVVINLLTNARDAMSGGGVLSIRTQVQSNHAELIVGDTGIGIPPALRERLFEPFVTTKGALGGGHQGGVGLGLSICYSIVHGHGGTIQAQSVPGEGSVFTVRLPLHRDSEDEAPLDVAPSQAVRPLRVLVVDDDSVIQALLRATLTRESYTVLVASDAESARALVQQGNLDAILCSLTLPGTDGLDLAQQLHREGWRLPFVLMTGRVDGAGLVSTRGIPIAQILPKPFQPTEVLATLQAAVATPPVIDDFER